MTRLALVVGLVGLGATAVAAHRPRETPALLAKGRAAFAANCIACHGERGDGNGPLGKALTPKPRAFATEPFKHGDSPEQFWKTVTEGLPGTPMPSFAAQLSDEDRWAVVYWVRHLERGGDSR